MFLKKIIVVSTFVTLSACSWNSQIIQQQLSEVSPTREQSVGFFSHVHNTVRDTERTSYNLLYSIRDGFDSFIFDVEKDYYNDYQK